MKAEQSERFEIIEDIPPFPFREGPGRHPIEDSQWIEGMMGDLKSNKYRTIKDAVEAYTEYAEGASLYATQRRLRNKLNAAIRADVMSIWLQYYILMFRLGL